MLHCKEYCLQRLPRLPLGQLMICPISLANGILPSPIQRVMPYSTIMGALSEWHTSIAYPACDAIFHNNGKTLVNGILHRLSNAAANANDLLNSILAISYFSDACLMGNTTHKLPARKVAFNISTLESYTTTARHSLFFLISPSTHSEDTLSLL